MRSDEASNVSSRLFIENMESLDHKDPKIREKRRRRRSSEDWNIEERYFKKLFKNESEEDNIKEKNENIICKLYKNDEKKLLEKKETDLDESVKKDLSTVFVGNLPVSIVSSKACKNEV